MRLIVLKYLQLKNYLLLNFDESHINKKTSDSEQLSSSAGDIVNK